MYRYTFIPVGHILQHDAVGHLAPAHLGLQLTDSFRPSFHLLPQL